MYLEYFDLKEKPFSLAPDPKYLYFSRSHKEALAQMVYAASQDTGFMVLTGEVGTGKTVLINALINQFPKNYHFAKIYHSAINPEGLLQNICKEFKLDYTNKSITELVLEIQDFLKWNYNSGGKSVLILDEAQNLSVNTLEEIRLLSNFESQYNKVMQIYLVGQPELENKLSKTNLRQLRERVSLKFVLDVLNRDETKLYINHRLMIAGLSKKTNLFLEEAIDEIYKISAGIPRRINILCDTALLLAYSNLFGTNHSKEIDAKTIKRSRNSSQMELYSTRELTDTAIQYFNKRSQPGKNEPEKNATTRKTAAQISIKNEQETIKKTENGNHVKRDSTPEMIEEVKQEFKHNLELLRTKRDAILSTKKVVPIISEKTEPGTLKKEGTGKNVKENYKPELPEKAKHQYGSTKQELKAPDENTLQKKLVPAISAKIESDPLKETGNDNQVKEITEPVLNDKSKPEIISKAQSSKNPGDETSQINKAEPQITKKIQKDTEKQGTGSQKKEDSTQELQMKKIEKFLNETQTIKADPVPITKMHLKNAAQLPQKNEETTQRSAITNRTKKDSTQELHKKAVEQLIKDSQSIKTAQHEESPKKNNAEDTKKKNINVENGAGNSAIDYDKIENIVNQIIENRNIFFAKNPKFSNLFFGGILTFIILVWAFYIAILLAVEFGILK